MKSASHKIAFIFLLFAVTADVLHSQVRSENSFYANLGADHLRLVDQGFTASRLKFTGTVFMASMAYENVSETQLLSASLQGSFGKVSTGAKTIEADADRVEINLSYAKSLSDYYILKTPNKVYAGAGISSYNFVLSNEPELENITISFYHTLNLLLDQTALINEKNSIRLKVTLPVMGWVKRSAYDGGANQELEQDKSNILKLFFKDSDFSVLNPLKIPRISIGYTRSTGPRTELMISYFFNYLEDNNYQPIRIYNNSLLAGFKFKFLNE